MIDYRYYPDKNDIISGLSTIRILAINLAKSAREALKVGSIAPPQQKMTSLLNLYPFLFIMRNLHSVVWLLCCALVAVQAERKMQKKPRDTFIHIG